MQKTEAPMLSMWTVYDHPTDYPDSYVARRFDVEAGVVKPSSSIIVCPDLETLRDILQFEMHLYKVMRSASDDPKIVETWL